MTVLAKATPPQPTSSWLRRTMTRPILMPYNRWILLVLLANLVTLTLVASTPGSGVTSVALTAATINLGVAALIRQQHVINGLFWIATRAPLYWPLPVRARLAKVYHFGGIHVGAAIAATGWFLVFTVSMLVTATESVLTRAFAITIASLLVAIVLLALPAVRRSRHDLFEASHRYGGWLALALFVALTVSHTADSVSDGGVIGAIVVAPESWVLVAVIVSVVLPWLRLRRADVIVRRPSTHVALLEFPNEATPFAGSSTAVARSPLAQWHSFANIAVSTRPGFRLAISRAGDWTGELIDDTPQRVWVKGVATAGVGNIDALFQKVVWVATGSGIGPCLPHLLAGTTPAKLIWATRAPVATYGEDLVDEILTAQPDATVWDTTRDGKPDLVQLALEAVHDSAAEAVICISNQPTTRHVVASLEARGIPAYGAIWDS